jgi:isopenicillin-N epimerase
VDNSQVMQQHEPSQPVEPTGSNRPTLASRWSLDASVRYLNHGSFGACPSVVLGAQQGWRDRYEAEPVRFVLRELETAQDAARSALAEFVGADDKDLVFVPNATAGVATILASIDFQPGDELLLTDHGYNACRNAAHARAAATGAHVVTAKIPFPLDGPDQVVDLVLAAAGPRTRLVLIDHITSPTALIFPVERIVTALAERGVDVLVDGAHAPGMVPLGLRALGAAYYTANCHKWLCAPKGVAFLHVREDLQRGVHPLITSHGANSARQDRSRFQIEFGYTGTDDPSARLTVPDAIGFLQGLYPGGVTELMRRNHELALAGRDVVRAALGGSAPAPDEMLGSMAALLLPGGAAPAPLQIDPLQEWLWTEHRIEVPVLAAPDGVGRLLRLSAQAYNAPRDYAALAAALTAAPGRLSGADPA